MKVRGLVHVHSTVSFDGTLTLQELHDLALSRGFGFVFITEHIEGLSELDLERLIGECADKSSLNCLLIPGLEIEAQCQYFLGMPRPVSTMDIEEARRQLLADGAVAVLAHPHRMKRSLTNDERSFLSAIEIWNVKDDGSRVPGYVGYQMWRRWRASSPSKFPAPIVGVDLHRREDFKPIGIEVEVERLDRQMLLEELRAGRFAIWCNDHVFDPDSISVFEIGLGRLISVLRSIYRKLRIRSMMPDRVRTSLRRILKG